MPLHPIDIQGQQFHRITVQSYLSKGYWLCKCSCGSNNLKIKSSALRAGKTKSCGCWNKEVYTAQAKTRSVTHGLKYTRAYKSWEGMLQRCTNSNNPAYPRYGGRGIIVQSEWYDFLSFYKDMGECPEGLTLDRIDPNLGYCKENCRWADRKVQSRNRGTYNRNLEYKGEVKTAGEWAEIYNLPVQTILGRISRGWSIYRSLTEPIQEKFRNKTK